MVENRLKIGFSIFIATALLLPLQGLSLGAESSGTSTDYQYGFQIGEENRDLYRDVIEQAPEIDAASTYGNSLARYYPSLLERLRGLADSLDLEMDRLLEARIYLAGVLGKSLGACTVVAAAPPATDGGIYSAWTMDLYYLLKLLPIGGWFPLFTVTKPLKGYRYLTFGLPVLAGIGMLNEKGLSCVVNAVPVADGGDGLLHMDLINLAMESCSNAEGAAGVIRDNPRFSPGPEASELVSQFLALNIQFVDAGGGIAAVEYTHNYFAFGKGEGGVSAQTNIHQFLDPALTECPTPKEMPAMTGTTMRLYRAWDLMRQNCGDIDLETIKSIMSDREFVPLPEDVDPYRYSEDPRYQQSISRDGWETTLQIAIEDLKAGDINIIEFLMAVLMMGGTCWSVIIEPDDMMMHWCPGHPDLLPYIPIYCADLLDTGGARGTNPLTLYVRVTRLVGSLLNLPVVSTLAAVVHDLIVEILKWIGTP